ncbi:leucine-rich repeat neuronal protein 1-like [Macrobrachium rosenbergii]|uniref:leucine-rich repeat neuronal protein 1-like n=1 Tax=Macrobrachium rosenbergii TaxID=79674 RepID=UPI0034D74EE5
MEFLMICKLCVNICFIVELFITWMRMVDGAFPSDLEAESYNATCYEGCTCGDLKSNRFQRIMLTFNCSSMNLKSFPSDIPRDIQVLDLRANSISKIPESIENLEELQELDLSGNRLNSMGPGVLFTNVSKLVYLNFGKNVISSVIRDNFVSLGNLEHLVISNNRIKGLDNETLVELSNLKTLDLQHNLFTHIYKEWFLGLKSLVILNLSYNKIQSIPPSVFRAMGSLGSLYLTGNVISTIDPRAFSGLLNLKVLALESNMLSRIPTAAFQSLPVLETLAVDQNPLNKIKPLDFSHLSVINISLSRMPELAIIDAKAFYNLVNVTLIQITDNRKLTYIDPLAFMNVDSLRKLHLNNNNLQGLQKEMHQFLPKGLQLCIHDNPFRCDCNVRWLRKLVSKDNTKNITLCEAEHISCQTPAEYEHKLLKYLDISRLPKVCPPVVLNLTQAQYIVGQIGERQVIECRALGSPVPQLHWILPDNSLVNSTLNEITRRFFPPGTLVYYHLEPADSGTYTCVAQNAVGSARSSVTLSAAGLDIFLFPVHVMSTYVTLVWNGTEKHAFPSYKIVYNRVSDNGTELEEKEVIEVSPSRKTLTIRHLRAQTNYQFCLGYEDGTGYWLEISCCYVTTAETEMNSGGIYRISLLTVIGLLGIVLLLTCLTMYLISSLLKSHRHRFYETPDKSTDSFKIPLVGLYRPLLLGS